MMVSVPDGGADGYFSWEIQGTRFYSFGPDNSVANDPLKLTNSSNPSTGDELMVITNAGVITLFNDLDVTEGGTGVGTLTSHGFLFGNGAGDIQASAEPSNGQLPIGSTGNQPVLATITAGAGVSVTNAAGSITIASTGSGMAYSEVTGAAQAMAVNTAYGANRGAGVTFTLPATAAAGTVMEITGILGLWILAQNAGQTVYFGDQNSTAGAGGTWTATHLGDCITLKCIVADTTFRITNSSGNPDPA